MTAVQYDGPITIAVGQSRRSTQWQNRDLMWSQLVNRLEIPERTQESAKEYKALPKAQRDEIKDVGGFVGGVLKGGRRKADAITQRRLLTLDLDEVPADADPWDTVVLVLGCAAVLYSTHSHRPDAPRLRLVMPLSRAVSPEEYAAVARKIAQDIGIDMCDDTTYEPHRLMYWPSLSYDAEYRYEFSDGPWLDVDEQLTIKSVNNGLEYIQSPQEYIDKYGLIERIWIDRRYEDPASLLSAAQVMLNELQDPLQQFEISFAELDESDYNVAQIGKRVRILQTELGTQVDTYVTELTYKYDDVPSSKIIVANKSTDIASSVADMADRQRIEQAYAQGATQLYSQSLQANCDSQNGAVMDFYLPEDMRIVNKIVAKVRVGSFRAYSKATKAAESKVVSSTTASQKTYSSTSGGGSTSTTSSGGGQTSGATTLESSNVLPSQTSGQAVHNHGLSRGARLATTSDGQTIDGYETFVWSGAHVHPAHTHEIDDHSHSVRIPSHSHNVTIPGHSHNITIPAHEHDITPGIYFYGSPRQFDLYVNGKKKATIVSTDTELDLTQYLVDTSSKLIPRGSWLSIEIRPNDLAYVSIDMFVQGFVQSRGDATV